jgi:hypothetical protein
MRHFSISQSAVASLKILSMEMVALAIELAASFSSLSRSWPKSAGDTSSRFRYADVLSNSFEVAKGIAHGGADVLFPHDTFLPPEKLVFAGSGGSPGNLDTQSSTLSDRAETDASRVFWYWKIGPTSKASLSNSWRKSEEGDVPLEIVYVESEGEQLDAMI